MGKDGDSWEGCGKENRARRRDQVPEGKGKEGAAARGGSMGGSRAEEIEIFLVL